LKVGIYGKKNSTLIIIIYGGKFWGKKSPKKKQKTLNTDQFSVCDLISKVLPPPVVLL
jgi:hypothetical protein